MESEPQGRTAPLTTASRTTGRSLIRHRQCLLVVLLVVLAAIPAAIADEPPLASLEQSFWLHASLAFVARKGYWGTEFTTCSPPTEQDVRNAAKLLADSYAANRLYLIYHHEIPLVEAERTLASRRDSLRVAPGRG